VKDNQQAIITRANDREFFPLINNAFNRFLLYLLVWLTGAIMMVGPAWAIAAYIISK